MFSFFLLSNMVELVLYLVFTLFNINSIMLYKQMIMIDNQITYEGDNSIQ
mgnify:FL=1